MAENSGISWTDHTFNPWIGCTHVSEGCRNCYAERDFDKRRHVVEWGKGKPRQRTTPDNWKKPLAWNRKAEKDGTRPRVFCASLADWLDPEVPIEWLADLLALIQATPHLDWLLLTKRPELFRERIGLALEYEFYDNPSIDSCLRSHFARDWYDELIAPANVWIGTTVENQKATARIPHLLSIPARVRFLSCEPMLGPVDLSFKVSRTLYACQSCGEEFGDREETGRRCPHCNKGFGDPIGTIEGDGGIDWVICGGESGPNARPMHPDWARSLRDQCGAAGVPFHHKQNGEWLAEEEALSKVGDDYNLSKMKTTVQHNEIFYWFGKKDAGRLLDGREWNELPNMAGVACA